MKATVVSLMCSVGVTGNTLLIFSEEKLIYDFQKFNLRGPIRIGNYFLDKLEISGLSII
jgi:hypothetical protein